jgi:hypothetical protein
LLCNMTVTLLWKCNKLIVTQQELLRYYGNAIWCIDHVTIDSASGDLSRAELQAVG